MLRLEGYRVCSASTAVDGLAQVSARHPDAIILDLRMPLVGGLEFLQDLRKRGERVPVTVVTGDYFIEDDIRTTLRTLGAQVKFKPLWVEELAGLVRSMFEGATESKKDNTGAPAQAVPPPSDWAR
jgi:DNA-binding response OmpR family regulator